jgi:hypothetical protein
MSIDAPTMKAGPAKRQRMRLASLLGIMVLVAACVDSEPNDKSVPALAAVPTRAELDAQAAERWAMLDTSTAATATTSTISAAAWPLIS